MVLKQYSSDWELVVFAASSCYCEATCMYCERRCTPGSLGRQRRLLSDQLDPAQPCLSSPPLEHLNFTSPLANSAMSSSQAPFAGRADDDAEAPPKKRAKGGVDKDGEIALKKSKACTHCR